MMEYFEAIHAGIRHKDAHIHTLLAQHGLHAHETAFIGDMQHDVKRPITQASHPLPS